MKVFCAFPPQKVDLQPLLQRCFLMQRFPESKVLLGQEAQTQET